MQAMLAVAMLGFMVVVADLGTALVPVITALVVFWVAGLERRYMLRVGLVLGALVVVAVFSRGYRLGRVISYFDPDYSQIETIDTHDWIRHYVESSSSCGMRDISRGNRRSRWAPAGCWAWA